MTDPIAVLGSIAAGLLAVGVIWKKGVRPIAGAVSGVFELLTMVREDHTRLAKVETQTRQLHPNGGSHLADKVTQTQVTLEAFIEKDTGEKAEIKAEVGAQESKVRAALDEQAEKVRAALEQHRGEVNAEIRDIWKSLAARDFRLAADE